MAWLVGGCVIAVLMDFAVSMRMYPNASDPAEEWTRVAKSHPEYRIFDEIPKAAEVSWNGRRWSPSGWIIQRSPGHRAYFDLHIPKTAGCSFSVDIQRVLAFGEGYFSKEACFHNEMPMRAGDARMALFRKPVDQVYSQFLECKYDGWGKSTVPGEDKWLFESATTWLKHFRGGQEHYDMNCYHPYNMQTRALTCWGRDCHPFQGEEVPLQEALDNLNSLFFVGIADHYQASLCLFFAKTRVGRPLPHFCNCADTEAWKSLNTTHEDHGVPRHSNSDLSQKDLAMIANLTQLDKVVYETALARFVEEAMEVKKRTGTQILC